MNASRLLSLSLAAALAAAAPLAAQPVDRSKPPEPGAVRPFHLPPVRTFSLSNGLPVMLVEKHAVPVASVLLAVRAGGVADPAGKPGVAAMTAEMLDEGAGGKDALAIDDAVSYLGAELSTSASWDASFVRLHVPVARLEPALALMADVCLRPDFPEKEWARVRKQKLTEKLEERSEPDVLAARAFARAVFGAHRYGTPVDGTGASVAALSLADLRAFHAQRWSPAVSAILVAGDVTMEALRPLLEAEFGAWKPSGAAPAPALAVPPQVTGRTLWLLDKPGAAQSAIRAGRVGLERSSPLYVPARVANTLLGGSFASRLNDNLREKHGWSYGAFSRFEFRRTAGVFSVITDVQTPATADALREILREVTGMGTVAKPEDVARARSFLALRYAEEFETTDMLTAKLAESFVYGFPPAAYGDFVAAAMAVTPQQVAEIARTRIDPKSLAIAVVGDLKVIEKPVRALNLAPVKLVTVDDVMGPAPKVE